MKIGLLFFGIIISSCTPSMTQVRDSKADIRAIRISRKFPEFNFATGKIIKYSPDEIEIYYHKNLVLYKEPYDYYWLNTSGGIDSIQKRISYLVCSNDNTNGYYFEMNNMFKGQYVRIDSFFQKKWYSHGPVDSLTEKCILKLKQSVPNADSGILRNVYSVMLRSDTTMTSTVILTYTNKEEMSTINYYSIAKEFDTIEGMKLNKILMINDIHYFKDYNYTMDQYEIDRNLDLIRIDSLPADVALYFRKASELDKQKLK